MAAEKIDRHKRTTITKWAKGAGLFAAGALADKLFGKSIDVIVDPIIAEGGRFGKQLIRNFFAVDDQLLATMEQPDPKNVEIVKRILGVSPDRFLKLAGGRDHYLFPDKMHHDNNWASHSVIKILQQINQDFEKDPEGDFNITGSFVCCGSPTSNARTAAFLEYEWIDPENHKLGFRRKRNARLKLPIQYELNTQWLVKRGLVTKNSVDDDPTPDWAVRLDGKLVETRTGERDFLLISRLPNWFESAASPSSKTNNVVTIFGGCHGSATGALRLVLNNLDLLRKLDALTDQHPFWQALVEVSHIESGWHPVTKGARYQAVALPPTLFAARRVAI